MSLEEVRNALVFDYADNYITEEEFLILYDEYESVNHLHTYIHTSCFIIISPERPFSDNNNYNIKTDEIYLLKLQRVLLYIYKKLVKCYNI